MQANIDKILYEFLSGFVQPYYLRRHMNSHKQNQKDRTSMEMLIESNTGSDEQIGIRSCPCILCRFIY